MKSAPLPDRNTGASSVRLECFICGTPLFIGAIQWLPAFWSTSRPAVN
jgi:hypothetical protein